jgi:hypothetical protein
MSLDRGVNILSPQLLFFSTGKRTDEVVDDAELIGSACCSDRGSGSEISA